MQFYYYLCTITKAEIMIVLFSTVLKKANSQMKSLHIQMEISNIPKLTFNLKQKKTSKLWNRSDNGRVLFLYHLKRKRRVMQCRNNLHDPSPLFCVLFKKKLGVWRFCHLHLVTNTSLRQLYYYYVKRCLTEWHILMNIIWYKNPSSRRSFFLQCWCFLTASPTTLFFTDIVLLHIELCWFIMTYVVGVIPLI